MPKGRKVREKGVSYRVLARPYDDKNYGEDGHGAIWVDERDIYKKRKRGEDAPEDPTEAVASGHVPQHYEEYDGDYEEDEYYEGDEEEWEWEEEEEEEEAPAHTAVAATSTETPQPSASRSTGEMAATGGETAADKAYADQLLSEWGNAPARHVHFTEDELQAERERETAEYLNKRNMHMAHDQEGAGDDDKLFEDEVEEEFTDDFLRQLVLGEGEEGEDDEEDGEDGDDDGIVDDAEDDYYGMGEETWNLLSEEEREAIRDTNMRGTRRRRKVGAPLSMAEDEVAYPTHEVTERAIDRQFTEMMKEFNRDARLNSAYTDDPRTHGPLSVDQYLGAVEEFAMDRAGYNLETGDYGQNKGLVQQLKFLAHRAGAFDTDRSGGQFHTTVLGDKKMRFMEEYKQETDRIRSDARQRLLQRQQMANNSNTAAEEAVVAEPEEEEYVVVRVKSGKVDRLDCETAVSAYSTYNNQPNIIRAPAGSSSRRANKKASIRSTMESSHVDEEEEEMDVEEVRRAIPTTRVKGETAEEKKMRRQAVKEAQRERRQEKSSLKKAYKSVEGEELLRAKTSNAARRTVHFL